MSHVIPLRGLKDTTLWKKLDTGFDKTADEEVSRFLASNLLVSCEEASDRMKSTISLHKQFTLHDETHLLRVTELMAKIVPERTLNGLNPIEISLLILAAFFHDQGMVLDNRELELIKSDEKFKIFRDNWVIEHPNLREVQIQLQDRNLSPSERQKYENIEYELCSAMLTDYVRQNHASRSAEFVKLNYTKEKMWIVAGTNLAPYVAILCRSHVLSSVDLVPENGFNHDESIGQYKVNLSYLSLVLRLADILDFDRDRTPDSLYRTIHFSNEISLLEWEKHRSVEGWDISPREIRFTMQCENPQYQKAAFDFMDLIDNELKSALNLTKLYPAEFEHYKFDLPSSVDRSRIKPKDDGYIYHDLEFSLSRNEIVKLLMTDDLYNSTPLCVRELLQNSMDALRYRRALKKIDKSEWCDGKIVLEHTLDSFGREVLRCTDNGIGMDEEIIEKHLTKTGRSYYRSPEFEHERARFREFGVDFDPCSQFGIGFMSCFMIGDRIIIRTRRDYGANIGWGKPLIVEINGLGGLVIIKKGSQDQQPGTSVEIIGRKKPKFFDEYEDKIKLISVVNCYALACEFPIEANCSIDELRDSIIIPDKMEKPITTLENSRIKSCLSFEQDFSEIDPNLNGCVRASFLIDENGKLALSNPEISWIKEGYHQIMRLSNGQKLEDHRDNDTICLDGIFVCGQPGRRSSKRECWGFTIWGNNLVNLGNDFFILDIRGSIKPPLTPSRAPPDTRFRSYPDPRWARIGSFAKEAHGRLWEKVAQNLGEKLDIETFWNLALIHRASISWMRPQVIWSFLSVPLIRDKELIEWRKLSTLGNLNCRRIVIEKGNRDWPYRIYTQDGLEICATKELMKWQSDGWENGNLNNILTKLIISMSTVTILNGNAYLSIRNPISEDTRAKYLLNSIFLLPYSMELKDYLCAQLPFNSINCNHPLVRVAFEAKYLDYLSDIQVFAKEIVATFGNSELLNIIMDPTKYKDFRINRILRHLGSLYLSIDWKICTEELSPPYKIWLIQKGNTQVTEDHFKQWASLERINIPNT